MRYDPAILRQQIFAALPPGLVVSEHTEKEHFYRVHSLVNGIVTVAESDPLYPSVTGELQILKDEGLINFKMNRSLEYIFANFKSFTDENIMDQLAKAEQMPADIFVDAGDVGTRIHDIRELIFSAWIETGSRPADFFSFIPAHDPDVRVQSAIAALDKFCTERCYIPVVTELKVYSHEIKKAGTLDDIGLMRAVVRPGDPLCTHSELNLEGKQESIILQDPNSNFDRCPKCDAKWRWELTLLDLKSSNRFKDSYFFQVAMYFKFFRTLTGIKPDRSLILKISKEDRTYKLEDLKRPIKIAQYIKSIVKVNEGMAFIKTLRKDNQKKVIQL